MLHIEQNIDLTSFNTLRLKSLATSYVVLNDMAQLSRIHRAVDTFSHFFVLGGGSNVILPDIYHGLIIHNQLLGVEITEVGSERIVTAMAGENWDDFVAYCCKKGAYGLENLSLIPGTVGASPIQNIGAYGVEVKDFIQNVTVYDLKSGQITTLSHEDCQFSYRTSFLKNNARYIVLSVRFKLSTIPNLNTSYGDVAQTLSSLPDPTPMDLREAIIAIRQSKLPDPKELGNVGSFFHNPILPNPKAEHLLVRYPKLPTYPVSNPELTKISAGWLIDNLGLKGFRRGNVGIYPKQALVLVNYGSSSQTELLTFAGWIQSQIKTHYDLELHIEPIVLN